MFNKLVRHAIASEKMILALLRQKKFIRRNKKSWFYPGKIPNFRSNRIVMQSVSIWLHADVNTLINNKNILREIQSSFSVVV
jgi:hypothetical protein